MKTRFAPTLHVLESRDVPATFVVNTLIDLPTPTPGTLRQAILDANATAGADDIVFQTGLTGTITLSASLPDITEAATITAAPGAVSIDGTNKFQILNIQNVARTVSITGLRFTQGLAVDANGGAISSAAGLALANASFDNNAATMLSPGNGQGGALYFDGLNGGDRLTLNNVTFTTNSAAVNGGAIAFNFSEPATVGIDATGAVTFTGNSAPDGGAIDLGPATLNGVYTFRNNTATTGNGGAVQALSSRLQVAAGSIFDGNQAKGVNSQGGAIYTHLTSGQVAGTTFTNNTAASGGAIGELTSDFSILDSLIANNTATASGGGLYSNQPSVLQLIQNTTFTGNTATASGGGIAVLPNVSAPVLLANCTLTANQANDGGGIASAFGAAGIFNSIVAGNTGGNGTTADISNATSLGGNVIGQADATTLTGLQASDVANVADPRLSTLRNNGGSTLTFGLLPSSPALGRGQATGSGMLSGFGLYSATAPAADARGIARPTGGPIDAGAFQVRPATAVGQSFTTAFGTPLTVAAPGLLTGATAGEPTLTLPVTLTGVSALNPTTAGTLTPNANNLGGFTFTPATGFTGNVTFTYRSVDSRPSAQVAATIAVGPSTPIVPAADTFNTAFNTSLTVPAAGVLANDTGGSAPLRANLVTPPPATAGTVALNSNGSFTFTPTPGFSGTTTFAYTATDTFTTSAATTVTVVVAAALTPTRVNLFAASEGAGGAPIVRTYRADGTFVREFVTMDGNFDGGVRTATGDVNGDSTDDVIVGAGPGGGPRVQVFDGATGTLLFNFFAYESTFSNGVFVSLGDVTGDGRADVIVGAGSLGGPRVRVLDGNGFGVVQDFFAYDPTFRGGVRVAVGDVDGDGRNEIVTGAGVSGAPHVRVLDGRTLAEKVSFFAYDSTYRGGVFVTVLNSSGEGSPGTIVTAPDSVPDFRGTILEALFPTLADVNGVAAGRAPNVSELALPGEVRTFALSNQQIVRGPSATPYGSDFLGGVRLAEGPAFQGSPTLVVAPGMGGTGIIRRFSIGQGRLTPVATDFAPFPDFIGSVYVG